MTKEEENEQQIKRIAELLAEDLKKCLVIKNDKKEFDLIKLFDKNN